MEQFIDMLEMSSAITWKIICNFTQIPVGAKHARSEDTDNLRHFWREIQIVPRFVLLSIAVEYDQNNFTLYRRLLLQGLTSYFLLVLFIAAD